MTKREVSKKMLRLRAEMDECVEWWQRLAEEATVEPEPELRLMGLAEVAEMLGVGITTASMRKKRGALPTPVAELRSGPVWLAQDIERLAARPA